MANENNSNKKDFRKHITAAKEWLGHAEESMDKENGVRSDLSLMLAQAELQRAKEKDDIKLWRKWLKWTVPWLAAIIIAAGYLLLLRPDVLKQEQADPVEGTATVNVTTSNAAASNKEAEAEREKPAGNTYTEPEAVQIPSVQENVPWHDPPQVNEAEIEKIQPSPLPVEDMHKLMQSAGKSLRE